MLLFSFREREYRQVYDLSTEENLGEWEVQWHGSTATFVVGLTIYANVNTPFPF